MSEAQKANSCLLEYDSNAAIKDSRNHGCMFYFRIQKQSRPLLMFDGHYQLPLWAKNVWSLFLRYLIHKARSTLVMWSCILPALMFCMISSNEEKLHHRDCNKGLRKKEGADSSRESSRHNSRSHIKTVVLPHVLIGGPTQTERLLLNQSRLSSCSGVQTQDPDLTFIR